MSLPTLTYSTINGQRTLTVDDSRPLKTSGSSAPAGTHDIKALPAGGKVLRLGNDLYEPLDVAEMRNRL